MNHILYLIGVLAIILAGVAHHLQLLVLVQIESGVMVFWGSAFFIAAKYGMKRTLTSFFRRTETNEFINDAIFVISSTGLISLVIGIVITMGHLTDGKGAIGQGVAAALVGVLYSILFSVFFVIKREKNSPNHNEVSQNSKSLNLNVGAVAGTLVLFFMVLWLMGD